MDIKISFTGSNSLKENTNSFCWERVLLITDNTARANVRSEEENIFSINSNGECYTVRKINVDHTIISERTETV